VIEVDVTASDEMKFSDYFENFRTVKLETSDSILLGEINSIVLSNDKIYLTDIYANTLYIFDKTGKFLSSINKQGQGPGEYVYITQFVVDGENIVTKCGSLRKIIIYTEAGEFISEQSINCSPMDISLLGNHNYVLYSGNDRAGSANKLRVVNFAKADKQFIPIDAVKSKYLHYRAPYNFFKKSKDTVRFFEPYNDTVYSVTKDMIEPAFYIDFKGKNIPQSFFKTEHENIFTFSQSVMQHEYAAGVFRFAENEWSKMFISYYQWNKARLTLFDMRNNTSKTFSSVCDDIFFDSHSISLNDFQYFAGENIVFPVTGATVAEWKKKYRINEKYKDIINTVNEDDNQVLFIFDLK
jgi:hypothetical protein